MRKKFKNRVRQAMVVAAIGATTAFTTPFSHTAFAANNNVTTRHFARSFAVNNKKSSARNHHQSFHKISLKSSVFKNKS